MKKRLSGLNMVHVSVCLNGNFSQELFQKMFIKSGINVICNQIRLAKRHKISCISLASAY